MRLAGDSGSIKRSPASAWATSMRGPLGFSRPQGAVLFSGRLSQARQSGSSEPGGGRNFKLTLIYSQNLDQACGAVHRHVSRETILPILGPPAPQSRLQEPAAVNEIGRSIHVGIRRCARPSIRSIWLPPVDSIHSRPTAPGR